MTDSIEARGISGKTALVTGAAQGIGYKIAEHLGKQGANVVVCDILSDLAQEAVRQLKNQNIKVIAVVGDISKPEDVGDLFKKVTEDFGGVDILVNNAGITRDNLLVRLNEKDWDIVIAVNLKGAFLCIKAAARFMMKKRYGRIINISSVVGVMGNAGQANYAASKAGLIGLTKSAAKELAGRGITVNAIAPGFITTDMTRNLTDEAKKRFMSIIPLKRAGTPDDIAGVVSFLVSDAASYITGQVIHVDGGMVM